MSRGGNAGGPQALRGQSIREIATAAWSVHSQRSRRLQYKMPERGVWHGLPRCRMSRQPRCCGAEGACFHRRLRSQELEAHLRLPVGDRANRDTRLGQGRKGAGFKELHGGG